MSLINCKSCGTVFRKTLRDICEKCIEIEKRNIEEITAFVKKCPNSYISIDEISKKLGIAQEELSDLYKKGRINAVLDRITVKCHICGVYTKVSDMRGHFCIKCSQEMMNDIDPKGINTKSTKHNTSTKKSEHTKETCKFSFKKSYEQ